jgi:hypothetical protein
MKLKNVMFLMPIMLVLTLSSFGQTGEIYTCKVDTYIHSNINVPFKFLDLVRQNKSIEVFRIDSLFNNERNIWIYYCKVKNSDNSDGWVLRENLMSKTEVEKANDKKAKEDKIYLQEKEKEDKIYLNKLVKKYGYSNAKNIFAKKIWIGMTKDMAILSWGNPETINRSVGSWGVHEQWVYGDAYLYFENGVLTSWQN